ncbi:hypothetical protein BX666DRAFT_1879016 [Dichotomocladium elegans]|nr:hypothetical protein BX666DRAFT_1879016 [Dichotomocladium elegans]
MRSTIFIVVLASVAVSLVQAAPVKNNKRQQQQQQQPAGAGGFGQYFGQGLTATTPLTTSIYQVIDPPTGSAAVAQGGVEGMAASANPLTPGGVSPTITEKTAMVSGAGTVIDGFSAMVAGGGTGAGGGGQQEP